VAGRHAGSECRAVDLAMSRPTARRAITVDRSRAFQSPGATAHSITDKQRQILLPAGEAATRWIRRSVGSGLAGVTGARGALRSDVGATDLLYNAAVTAGAI
jgi:hypothetical protein